MGRLVLVSLGVLAVAFASTRAADLPSMKGTWVRESMVGPAMGNQVILTFTDHRVTARFRSGGRDPGGHEGWITLEFEGEYARTDSGLLVGTITGLNVDLSKIPEGDSPGEPLGKSVAKMIGEPFCFRARVSEGALTVTDLKVPDVKIDDEHSSREMIAGFASGKYVSSPTENVPVPKLKAAKAMEFRHTKMANNLTAFMWLMSRPRAIFSSQPELPTPHYLKHHPEYFPPEPGQLPSMMPSAAPMPMAMSNPVTMAPQSVTSAMPAPFAMAPQPMPMPWAMPTPVTNSSQPMPSAMPASMVTMPLQPMPQYVSAEVVPGGFFYFRPCRVEEVITMTNQNMPGLPIVLPVTPAFVPQPAGIYGSVWMPEHENKIRISTPCWLGTTVTPISQAMQIPNIDLPVQAALLRQHASDIREIEGPWRRFWFNDESQQTAAQPSATPAPVSMAPSPAPMLVVPAETQSQIMLLIKENRFHEFVKERTGSKGETVIREIDLGEAGTMQVIVRMKGGNVKPMMPAPIPTLAPMRVCPPETVRPSPSPVSQLPMMPPSPILPTAGQMLPPGSMRNVPVMPAIADAWKQSTAPVVK